MQDAPTQEQLLAAVARFLEEELGPALAAADPRLAERARVAAQICRIAVRESSREEAQDAGELTRLSVLFPDDPAPYPATRDARRGRITALTERMVLRLKNGEVREGERSYLSRLVKETLRERLAVNDPTFDLSADIETATSATTSSTTTTATTATTKGSGDLR